MTEGPPSTATHAGRLGMFGAFLALTAMLVPLALDYRTLELPSTLLGRDGAPRLALAWPLLVLAVGAAVSLAPRLSTAVRAGAMAAVGAAGAVFAIAPLGRTCAGPEAISPLFSGGLVLAGAAAGARLLRPADRLPRVAVLVAAALVAAALLLPHADAAPSLPGELSLYLEPGALTDVSLLRAELDAIDGDVMVGFLALWQLLPLVLLAAVVIAPAGPLLRPLVWAVVLYLPLTWLLYAANIRGWTGVDWVRYRGHVVGFDDFTRTAAIGRLHVAAAAAAYAVWAQTASTMLYAQLRARR